MSARIELIERGSFGTQMSVLNQLKSIENAIEWSDESRREDAIACPEHAGLPSDPTPSTISPLNPDHRREPTKKRYASSSYLRFIL